MPSHTCARHASAAETSATSLVTVLNIALGSANVDASLRSFAPTIIALCSAFGTAVGGVDALRSFNPARAARDAELVHASESFAGATSACASR